MKKGQVITEAELMLAGYEILTRFATGYIWKRTDGLGQHIMWHKPTQTITLIYGDEERYATAL